MPFGELLQFTGIEQCGDCVVVTGGGIIHDMRADGTVERGVHDVAEFDKTTPITVVATYEDVSMCSDRSASPSRCVVGSSTVP